MEMLVDTSALIAFFVRSEKYHLAAQRYVAQHPNTRWVILETVFDEFVTWMRIKISISSSIQVGHALRQDHIYVNTTSTDDAATWEAFCQYDDKLWSYTDCSILVMAQRRGIARVFSFDDHIRQMTGLGIHCVP
jgi:uncharacterized protein